MYAQNFFSKGIREIGNIIKKTKITPEFINVGGGFPSVYPDLHPEPLLIIFKKLETCLRN